MEQPLGYFCRAFVGQDVQANVIAYTFRDAELEVARMIRGGASAAHAVQHGSPDHEPVLVATAYGGVADGEMWRYLRHSDGMEFDRWQSAYLSKTRILEERWVVLELSATGIKEYGAFGKAVRAIWGSTALQADPAVEVPPQANQKPAPRPPLSWKTG